MNKKIGLLLIVLVFNGINALAQRKIDIAVEMTYPDSGQTFQSPVSNLGLKFLVINLGPDTINTFDWYQLRAWVGGEIRYSELKYFSRIIPPGTHDSMIYFISFSGNVTINDVKCCMKIEKFGTDHPTDVIVSESTLQKKNNEGCVLINHIAKGVGIIESQATENPHYPNPVSKTLFFKFNINSEMPSNVFISNNIGQKKQMKIEISNDGYSCDVSAFPSGIYYLTYNINGEFYNDKLIILK